MSGIIACHTEGSAVDYLLIALRRLENLRYDSAGVAVQTADGGVARLRTVDRIGALERAAALRTDPEFGGVGIGHTRCATTGSVSITNAHPHTDCSGRISLVHNGVIENADDLRQKLTKAGHRFVSSVDSEVICHVIEDQLKSCGNLREAVRAALPALEGSWAIAVMQEGPGRVVVAASRSPMLIGHTSVGDFACSDITAVAEWVDEFYALEDGDVVELARTTRLGDRGDRIAAPTGRCVRGRDTIELDGCVDYMARSLGEQPAAAATVPEGGVVRSAELWRDLDLPPFQRLRIVGCRRTLNAGRVMGELARRLDGLSTRLDVAGEVAGEMRLAGGRVRSWADVVEVYRPIVAEFGGPPKSTLALRLSHAGTEKGS